METLLAGLTLAMISGLAWIAYNHSQEFKMISNVLYWISTATLISMMVYNLGVNQGSTATQLVYIQAHAGAKADDAARAAASAVSIPWVYIGLMFLFMMYLMILSLLPYMLKLPNREPKA